MTTKREDLQAILDRAKSNHSRALFVQVGTRVHRVKADVHTGRFGIEAVGTFQVVLVDSNGWDEFYNVFATDNRKGSVDEVLGVIEKRNAREYRGISRVNHKTVYGSNIFSVATQLVA